MASPTDKSTIESNAGGQGRRDDLDIHLPLFRFRLRHLFWFVTLVSAVLAVAAIATPAASIAILLSATIVAGHVASTILGGRMRSGTDSACRAALKDSMSPIPATSTCEGATQPPNRSRRAGLLWEKKRTLSRLPQLILMGMVAAGGLGIALLEHWIGDRTTPAGIVVGGMSLSIVGGWLVFIAASFSSMVRQIWLESRKPGIRDR